MAGERMTRNKISESFFWGEKNREAVTRDFAVARPTLDRLASILLSKMVKPKFSDYEKAAWPYFRADADGYNRALTEVLELIRKEN